MHRCRAVVGVQHGRRGASGTARRSRPRSVSTDVTGSVKSCSTASSSPSRSSSSIGSRTQAEIPSSGVAERVYLFAHETLHARAERQFGASLNEYRMRLHTWAGRYQALHWPAETPT